MAHLPGSRGLRLSGRQVGDVELDTLRTLGLLLGPLFYRDLGMATVARLAKASSKLDEVTDIIAGGITERELGRWYRGEHRPQDAQVWCTGQALRHAGIPWCSGLSLLWVCGRLVPCVRIVAILLSQPNVTREDVDTLWQMFAHGEDLYEITPLDGSPSLVDLYLKSKEPQEATIEAAIAVLEEPNRRDGAADDLMGIAVQKYIHRELAKLFWLPYDKMRGDVHQAAVRVFEDDEPLPRSQQGNELAPFVLQIANTDAPIKTKREVLLNALAQWMNEVESRPAQPCAREIKSGFTDAVYPDLRKMESYRRFHEWLVHSELRR